MPNFDSAAAAAESRRYGRELAIAFSQGASPQPVAVPIHLQPGEACFGQVPVTVVQWLEGDDSYIRKSGGYMLGGGGVGVLWNTARLTANVVGNKSRKKAAEREAAGAWRPVEQGQLYLTNRRFAIAGSQWIDLWYSEIRTSDVSFGCIRMQISGMPSTALDIPHVDYWFVMYSMLAHGRVMMPPEGHDQPYQDITPQP